jgi:hypothetical protein
MKTKWFFILDSDQPANNLKKFIDKEYREYIDKDVFIFQYNNDIVKNAEFEDLLPDDLKLEVYNKVLSSENKSIIDTEKYSSLTKGHSSFAEQYEGICNAYDLTESNIKGLFKEMLNNALENEIKNSFDRERYGIYLKWFDRILTICKEHRTVQTVQAQ